jgi:hypothetical protein
MEKKTACQTCGKRDQCLKPCKPVNEILWKDNRVMERHFEKEIVCYPKRQEVHFSEVKGHELERISGDDVMPWSSGDAKLHKTAVFIERFFNKVPCKELAERYGVKENTIVCMYADAVEQLGKIIKALDARKEGLKAVKSYGFTDDQKLFLLVCIFGFSGVEVARMFNRDHKRVSLVVKRMADRYKAQFAAPEISEIP